MADCQHRSSNPALSVNTLLSLPGWLNVCPSLLITPVSSPLLLLCPFIFVFSFFLPQLAPHVVDVLTSQLCLSHPLLLHLLCWRWHDYISASFLLWNSISSICEGSCFWRSSSCLKAQCRSGPFWSIQYMIFWLLKMKNIVYQDLNFSFCSPWKLFWHS